MTLKNLPDGRDADSRARRHSARLGSTAAILLVPRRHSVEEASAVAAAALYAARCCWSTVPRTTAYRSSTWTSSRERRPRNATRTTRRSKRWSYPISVIAGSTRTPTAAAGSRRSSPGGSGRAVPETAGDRAAAVMVERPPDPVYSFGALAAKTPPPIELSTSTERQRDRPWPAPARPNRRPNLRIKENQVDTWQAIDTTRAIRKFAERPLEPEHLRRILDAGRRSGSSKNQQSWDFIVCTKSGASPAAERGRAVRAAPRRSCRRHSLVVPDPARTTRRTRSCGTWGAQPRT